MLPEFSIDLLCTISRRFFAQAIGKFSVCKIPTPSGMNQDGGFGVSSMAKRTRQRPSTHPVHAGYKPHKSASLETDDMYLLTGDE